MVPSSSSGGRAGCYKTLFSLTAELRPGGNMGSAANSGLSDALGYLEAALTLLDAHDAPAHIGAHVDLAICQLKEHLQTGNPGLDATVQSLQASAPLRH